MNANNELRDALEEFEFRKTDGAAERLAEAVRSALDAPEESPSVERFAGGLLVHWPDGITCEYEEVGECVTSELAPAQAPAERVPDGYVLVPREPTPEMWEAGMNCHSPDDSQGDYLEKAYSAMLADAPAQAPDHSQVVEALQEAVKACNGPMFTEKQERHASWLAVSWMQTHGEAARAALRAIEGEKP